MKHARFKADFGSVREFWRWKRAMNRMNREDLAETLRHPIPIAQGIRRVGEMRELFRSVNGAPVRPFKHKRTIRQFQDLLARITPGL